MNEEIRSIADEHKEAIEKLVEALSMSLPWVKHAALQFKHLGRSCPFCQTIRTAECALQLGEFRLKKMEEQRGCETDECSPALCER